MAKKSKKPKRLLTLEEQLAEHDRQEPRGPVFAPTGYDAEGQAVDFKLEPPSSERMAWVKRRLELTDAIRRRDGKRLADPGHVAGKYGPSPMAQRGHKVEVAPKKLDKALSKDSEFPKRVTTQRVIDRLKARGTITQREWRAAEKLWEWWNAAITGDRLVAAYEPVAVHASPNTDRLVSRRMEAAEEYLDLMGLIPTRCRGVVTHVVINDWELSDWGLRTAKSERARRRQAADRLSQGLRALAGHLGY